MHDSVKRVSILTTAGAVLALVGTAPLASANVLNDTFDSGDPNNLDGWSEVLGMAEDDGISVGPGTGPMAGESVFIGNVDAGINAVGRSFTSTTLENEGDSIAVRFDFLLTSPFSSTTDNRPAFGLYNSNDTPGDANDDPGYQASFYSFQSPGNNNARVIHESGSSNAPLAGTDIFTIASSSTYPNITQGDLRHYELILTRVTVGEDPAIHLTLNVTDPDGEMTPFTLEGTAPTTRFVDTFDTFYLRSNNVDYELDNLQIQFIPEPGSLALLGAAGLMLVRRRR